MGYKPALTGTEKLLTRRTATASREFDRE